MILSFPFNLSLSFYPCLSIFPYSSSLSNLNISPIKPRKTHHSRIFKDSISGKFSPPCNISVLGNCLIVMMITYYQNWVTQLLKEYHIDYPWIPCTSILCGIFACKLVYDLSHLFSPVCFKHYSALSKMKQIEWDNRVISTLHAIFSTILSIYLAFWSDLYSDDLQRGPILFRSTTLSTFVLGVSVGYFLSDLAMIFWFYPALGGLEYVLHHLLSMGGLAYTMLTGLGQFYAYMVLVSETTTPGINLRWYLDTVGMRKSKAYVANGVGIFLTWLVARVFLFMYVFYHIYAHYDQIKELPYLGYYLIIIAPCVLGCLNLMWFSKITKGMVKTLSAKKD